MRCADPRRAISPVLSIEGAVLRVDRGRVAVTGHPVSGVVGVKAQKSIGGNGVGDAAVRDVAGTKGIYALPSMTRRLASGAK
jgi:hypothetical protein